MLIAFEKEKPNTSQNRLQLLTQDLFKEAVKREKWFALRLQHCALIKQNMKEKIIGSERQLRFFLPGRLPCCVKHPPINSFFGSTLDQRIQNCFAVYQHLCFRLSFTKERLKLTK